MCTDSDLIAASLAEPVRFGELFDRHAPRVHRFVARRLGQDLADDIVAQTFLIAFEQRDRFENRRSDEPNASALPWLFGIAGNLTRRHHRLESRGYRAMRRSGDSEVIDPIADVAQRIDDARAVDSVLVGLARLAPDVRQTLLLFAWGELSYEEVADATGVPIGTVRSRISRARNQLRALHSRGPVSTTPPRLTTPPRKKPPRKEEEGHGRDDTAAESA